MSRVATVSAPGRVNLLGEHTDHQQGLVLPTAIPQRTTVEAQRQEGPHAVAFSETLQESAEWVPGHERRRGDWSDYVQGVTWALRQAGHPVPPVSLRIRSEVPRGSGLASSAALEMATLKALRELLSLELDDVGLALVAVKAENGFVGAPVGVMDPLAAALCEEGQALFLDTRSLARKAVAMPSRARLLVIDSGLVHEHTAGDYKKRKAECDHAASLLGVTSLREVSELKALAALPVPYRKRARHVVTENARVLEAVAALQGGDLQRLGRLFDQSHASQRDDYECSLPQIDQLVALARRHGEVLGARLTGGGFGGAIVVLLDGGDAAQIGAATLQAYERLTDLKGRVVVPWVR